MRPGPKGERGDKGECVGVLGANIKHHIGGYFGWRLETWIKNRHPLASIEAKVNDILFFRTRKDFFDDPTRKQNFNTDVYLFNQWSAWRNCDFSNEKSAQNIATKQDMIDGFEFRIMPSHAGKTLYDMFKT